MFTLNVIGLSSLAYVCTFAWLWRFVIEAITGRRSPEPLWPPFEFSPRYAAFVILRAVYCALGGGVAILSVVLIMKMVLVPPH
ncbi:MAG: hypothetical protein DMF19_09400 [Verrucomicrobia bacterium]|nr:MAG: hypothetical protein DMF19_09400 [Verrucomicrobiota bacterium]